MISLLRHTMLLVAMLFYGMAAHGMTADEILNDAANRYQSHKSITATFTITESGNTVNGTIVVAGDRFNVITPMMTIWYDGRTQWSYSPSVQEVNITEPTVEELQQINPFAIISAFRKNYKATMLSKTANRYCIKLTPLSADASNISQTTLTLNTSTLFPTEIHLITDNNNAITISVKDVKIGKSLPISTFTFDAKNYPDAEIVDLR